MTQFPGPLQPLKLIARLKAELLKTVLEAALPRAFIPDWDVALSGGYGLDLTVGGEALPYWPDHWTTLTLDPLCPILEAYLWRDLHADAVTSGTGAAAIAPFTWEDLQGLTSGGSNLVGSGFLLVDVNDQSAAGETFAGPGSSAGGREETSAVIVSITGRVPARRGRFQADFYANLLANVLRRTTIKLGDEADLDFPDVVPRGADILGEDTAWLNFGWEVIANRRSRPQYPFA